MMKKAGSPKKTAPKMIPRQAHQGPAMQAPPQGSPMMKKGGKTPMKKK